MVELGNGAKSLLKFITGKDEITEDTFYEVVDSLHVSEFMIQSSLKSGKVPSGNHIIDLSEEETNFKELLK